MTVWVLEGVPCAGWFLASDAAGLGGEAWRDPGLGKHPVWDGFWQASDAAGLGAEAWRGPGLGRSSVERAVALMSARGEDLRASCLPCLKAPEGKASLVVHDQLHSVSVTIIDPMKEGEGLLTCSGMESGGSSPLAHLFMVRLPQFTHSFSRPTPLFGLYFHKPP